MELLEKFIEKLEELNKRSFELSKTYPDKTKRHKFRDYCGAYTHAIVEAKELLKQHAKA